MCNYAFQMHNCKARFSGLYRGNDLHNHKKPILCHLIEWQSITSHRPEISGNRGKRGCPEDIAIDSALLARELHSRA